MSALIDVRHVTKKYGQKTILNDLSLQIMPGEIMSLLGVNGAGKTTLSTIIASLHPPSSGDVLFKGKSIYDDLIRYRQQIGFCPQKPNISPSMTVKDHLMFAGRYFLVPYQVLIKRADELMDTFGLHEYADKSPTILSGGYKQRLLIARSLMHSPALIILDEPTVALDPHIRRYLWSVIKDVKAAGVSVLLTTHYIDEAEMLSDRICVLDKGKIRLMDTPQNLMSTYNKNRLEDVFLQLLEEETTTKRIES